MEITDKLDQLADFHSHRDALEIEKADLQSQIDSDRLRKIVAAMPPEIVMALAEIDAEAKAQREALEAEFTGREEAVEENITRLEAEIRELVKACGQTVKGKYIQAVYSRPRVTWDTAHLDSYATVHPEILSFRKEGEPSVSIRVLGK